MHQKWCPKRAKPPTPYREAPGTQKRSQNDLPWPPFGLPLAPLWPPLASLSPSLGPLWPLSGLSWSPFGFLRLPLSTPSPPFDSLRPLGLPFGCTVTKSKPKWHQNGPQNPRNPARDRKQQSNRGSGVWASIQKKSQIRAKIRSKPHGYFALIFN